MADKALRMSHIVKIYPNGVMANRDVVLSVNLGEIHALLGENGVGRSTLMKILLDKGQPVSGEIFISGRQVHMSSLQMAIKVGIGIVHQHFMLMSPLTVVKDIILDIELREEAMVDLAYARKQVEEMGRKCNLYMEPDERMENLTVGQKQKVGILRALFRGAKILILSEPMAVLISQEIQELFERLLNLRGHGYIIVFISHKLQEIKQICNRIIVIRRRIIMGIHNVGTVSKQDISRLIVGRGVILDVKKGAAKPGEALVKVKDLVVVDENGEHAVGHISFSLREGEILRIAEMEGNGQVELVHAITGMGVYSHGTTKTSGQDTKGYSVEKIRNLKLVHIPANRMTMGMAPHFSITENMIADKLGWKRSFRKGVRDRRVVKEYGKEMVKWYLIFCKSQDMAINGLSGGNTQKAVLVRELSGSPQVIIADQPTRGMGVGVTEFIRQRPIEMRDEGNGIVLVTSDLNEVLGFSDSPIVMYEGRTVTYISDTFKMMGAQLGTYMLGVRVRSEEEIKGTRHKQ